jgi:hypothetical protein
MLKDRFIQEEIWKLKNKDIAKNTLEKKYDRF